MIDWLRSLATGRVPVEGDPSDEELVRRVRATRRDIEQLRVGFGVSLPLLFVLFGWNMYTLIRDVDQQELLKRLDHRATTTIWPAVSHELERLARDLTPVFLRTFGEKFEHNAPRIADSLDRELSEMQAHLERKPEQAQKAMRGDLAARLEVVVADAFPDIKDAPERRRLAEDAAHRLSAWSTHRLALAIEDNVNVLVEMKKTIDDIQLPQGRKASTEDVLGVVMELLNHKLTAEKI